ncbi:hypothetical protein QBC47DRAFT_460562 [Echria macrotheca]|uniref:Uncharacterized protein n=1 Tax=Echria macrotheca TaxID=438768 RepID=A0AAJ0BC75_9PEZI|nr:hypothetical protein QBC47DRAFT_460562 [Echria macrotheca]
MNPPSKAHPEKTHVGPKETGGMAGAVRTPANAHLGVDVPRAFDSQGSIGKQFSAEGKIGGVAQSIGGPLKEDGLVGRQFTDQGIVGGSVQKILGGQKRTIS